MEPDDSNFLSLYDLIGSSHNYPRVIEKGRCRICNKTEPDVTFKKEAHLLSRFLGSNFTIDDECDECNALFSKWENDLAIFMRPFLVLHGVEPGKSKIPIFQSRTENRDEQTRSTLHYKDGKRELSLRKHDDCVIDDVNKIATITFRKPPYTPLNIYKVLVKIGIELLPSDLMEENRFMCDCLLNKGGAYTCSTVFRLMSPRKMYKQPFVLLFKAKEIKVADKVFPRYVLILVVTNLAFQFILPVDKEFIEHAENGLKIEIPCFTDSSGQWSSIIKHYDMSVNEKVLEDEVIQFSFQGHIINESDDTIS